MKIRPLFLEYLDQVCLLEQEAHGPLAWSRKAFLAELRKEFAAYWVAEEQGQILGFTGIWYLPPEGQITNLAVAGASRGQGIGTDLLGYLLEQARKQSVEIVSLEVRASNQIAQRLYTKLGFQESGRRIRYYRDTGEDALILSKQL